MKNNNPTGKGGVKFGQGQNSTQGGRKQSLITRAWQIEIDEQTVTFSKEDKYRLIEQLMELPLQKVKDIANNVDSPIFITTIAKALLKDLKQKKTKTIDIFFKRFFGK
jgi:hypothetical protein